ncbi:MAG TPA: hypothetical protein VKV73_08155 [Chloroflexota bacterium]|nr:hypothetical protein [Chloroflexota bacterium]
MRFRAGDLEFNASVAETREVASRQTGEMLRSITIQFRAQKEAMHAQALAEAEQRRAGGLFSFGEAGETPETEWRVHEHTFSYVGSEPWGINHHVWRIEEVERLACAQLIIGSVTLEPYEYVEQVADGDSLRLAARATVSEADLEALSRMADPVDVVRVGISSTPRRMRLDGYVWGPGPSGLGVALACEDLREPRVSLAGIEAVPGDEGLEDLIAILQARALLGDQDLVELRERGRARRHAARRVASITGWSL